MSTRGKPKVFISYTWLDKKEIDGSQVRVPDQRAFELAERLREDGFDSRIDLYFRDSLYGFVPPERVPGDNRDPWIIWAEEQIGEADCVLSTAHLNTPHPILIGESAQESGARGTSWMRT